MMARPGSVSMLGKLFSLGSGAPADEQESHQSSSSKAVSSLESVQEDIHTRSLLFPDTNALYLHRNDQVFPLSTAPALPPTTTLSAFDYNCDVDLELRDVRVLVMQDTLGSVNASLLFDSHPGPVSPSPVERTNATSPFQDPRRTPTSPRKSSLGQGSRPVVIQPDSPQLRQGAFDRRASMHGRTQNFAETEVQRAAREYREELATFTSCIFGSSELMAYKGTSTKVHVVPTESRFSEHSSILEGRGSAGRSSMRSSRLAQSYSSELVSPVQAPPSFMTSHSIRPVDRKKVLITRLFPVILPTDDDANQSKFSDDSAGYPFPTAEESAAKKRKPQPKQKRTPMYAVVLVIQLPPGPAPVAKTPFRGPSSLTDQESFPSSFNSGRRSGWTMVGSGLFNDSLDSVLPFDGEDQMDYITQHWDIIMRTLTHLQSVVATTLGSLLKQTDQAFPDPYPAVSQYVARTPSLSGRRAEEQPAPKPPKTNSKIVTLPPNALSQDARIIQEADGARMRIVAGLKAARVVTGQGRWGIWRDEARLSARLTASNDQHSFFFNLLTGFLATHTDWLQALSPAWYRKRHIQLQKSRGEEDLSVPARSIIVSEDKMAARRLIFLLSAFLPAQQQLPAVRAHRPSTSASFGALSHSPPSVIVPIGREESLRRKMTRRSGPRRASHSRTVSQSTRTSIPANLAHLSIEPRHERRSSDAASVRTANLAIPCTDYVTRKSSAATTTTVATDTTVPHFSTMHGAESRRSVRPGSSSSVATDDLRRTLTRGESMGQASITSSDSRQSSRWGSVISGLWSGSRRRDSTNISGETYRSPSSREGEPMSPSKRSTARSDKMTEMVRELSMPEAQEGQAAQDDPETPRGLQEEQAGAAAGDAMGRTRRWPDSAAFDSPVKTSINIEDGVIDVDVPFPDYLTSFDTAVSSPSSSGYLSTPGLGNGLEAFEQASRLSVDGDMPLNSAGWLQTYHADFALQAIPPQQNLVERVKASLRAEPSPTMAHHTHHGSPGSPGSHGNHGNSLDRRWVDVSSAIIADATSGKVTRIRYRRLIRPKHPMDRSAAPAGPAGPGGSNVYSGALLTPSILPYEMQLEDEFIEDEINTADDMLVEAVERVVALTGDFSKGSSSNSSRSNSQAPQRERATSRSPPSEGSEPAPRTPTMLQEVPRNECKTVVLTALGDVIRDVMEKRDEGQVEATEDENAIRASVRTWLESLEGGDE